MMARVPIHPTPRLRCRKGPGGKSVHFAQLAPVSGRRDKDVRGDLKRRLTSLQPCCGTGVITSVRSGWRAAITAHLVSSWSLAKQPEVVKADVQTDSARTRKKIVFGGLEKETR